MNTPDTPSDTVAAQARLDQATEAWISVVRTYQQCTAALAQRLEPHGISVLQHEVLMNLRRTPGLTQQHLSDRCFSAKSGISMIVAKWVKEGIVARERSASDSRAWNLSLTARGVALADTLKDVQDQVVLAMTQDYGAEDLEQIKEQMAKASARLLEMGKEGAGRG